MAFLDMMNNPMLGLAAGLLSGRDPGQTLAGGLSRGLLNMQNMQQTALQGAMIKAQLEAADRAKQREEQLKAGVQGLLGKPAQNTPIAPGSAQEFANFDNPNYQGNEMGGLLSQPATGMNKDNPQLAGILGALPPDMAASLLSQATLQGMKVQDPTAKMQDYKFLISQGYTPDQAMKRVYTESSASTPYYQFLPGVDANGNPTYLVGNSRTGTMSPGSVNGVSVAPAQYSPNLQGQIAGAKASGETAGKYETQRQIDAPKVVEQTNYAIDLLDQLKNHPGLGYAVGKSSVLPVVPGTDAADFVTRLKQVEGQQFMQAYQTLKGGGQITEIEGHKATEAMARLSRAQTEEAFKKSATELQSILKIGADRLTKGIVVNPKAVQQESMKSGQVRKYNPATGMIE